jgi:AbrB family looped-hinge helix DNA binding protein
MKRIALPFIAHLLTAGVATGQSLAFTNVTVINVAGGVAEAGRTVVVEGDRITAVGAADEVEVPAGAFMVDGTGKFLIPGLWDMHVHSWDKSVQRDIFLPLYVAHGVTGVREMTGEPYELETRAEVAAGTLPGPRMLVSSPIVDGPNPMSPGSHRPRVADADQARRTVDALKTRGYDLIQTHQFLSPAAYRALHERAREVGMEVSGTIPISVSLWEAAALGHRTVEHLWGVELACSSREEELRVDYRRRVEEISADTSLRTHVAVWNRAELEPLVSIDAEKCQALYRHLAANQTWVVPTLLIQLLMAYPSDSALQNDPRQRYLPDPGWALEEYADFYDPERRLRATYEHRLRTLVDLQRAGVGILAGSEVQAGFSLHDELALYVESGLTPLEALRTATLNPARYMGATDSLGTVEAGKIADLVLLDANPLNDIESIREIRGVVLNGTYLDREALDALLTRAERAAASEKQPVDPDSRMRITSKGQVTIPQDIRERIGLLPDTEVEFEVVGNAVKIRKA